MDMNMVAKAWQLALRQFIDFQSPFGQAKTVASVILILLAVLAGMVASRERRPGHVSLLEAWIGSGFAIIIGLNTMDALTATVRQLLLTAAGRELGGAGVADLLIGVSTLMVCLAFWGLGGLTVMSLARALGRWVGERSGAGPATPAS
jgi:hypothetical protein